MRDSKRGEVEEMLRRAIREGRLATGGRVPATRTLAAELGVARGTVVEAYAQLAAEGWLTTRPGAPTRVSARTRTPPMESRTGTGKGTRVSGAFALAPALTAPPGTWVHDLQPGVPDLTAFPMAAWLAAMRRAARRVPAPVLGYGEPQGASELRQALAGYLSRTRGVVADPERIVICSGFSGVLAAVAAAVAPGRVAMEDPGLPLHREIVVRSGARVVPLPVDEHGAAADPGDVAAAVVTPAHQYPLGMILSPTRRAELLDWARRSGGLLVEDDYDGEFRYDRQPISALQGLAPDHVCYVGTASKSLAPGLRLAWVVVPERFAGPFAAAFRWRRSVPVLDQLALAEMLDSGTFDRHLRRSRLVYRQRRDELQAVIESIGPPLHLRGIAAGLHAVVELPAGPDVRAGLAHEPAATPATATRKPAATATATRRPAAGPATETAALEVLRRHAVGVHPLGPHWQGTPRASGLVVGYSRPPAHAWRAGLEALERALREVAQSLACEQNASM